MNSKFWVIRYEMCDSNFSLSISLTPSLLCFHLDLAEKKKLRLGLGPPEKRDLVNPFSCSFVSSPLFSTLTSTIFYLHFLLFGQPSKPLLC